MIGVATRPRVYCTDCANVVYCDTTRNNPVTRAKAKLRKIHKLVGCQGKIRYAAGAVWRRLPNGGY